MNIMHSTVLKQINAEAQELIDKPMPTLSEWAFDEFYRNGNREKYEKLYFERRKMLAVYGLKAMAEGENTDAETLDRLNYVLFEVLTEETWALPAHTRKYEDDDWENTVDLFACETASAIGLIYRYAGDFLPGFLKDCMVKEVKKRVLEPFFRSGKIFDWEGCNHNWNGVCAGGIGIALLTLGEAAGFSEEEAERGLNRIKKSLATYLDTAFTKDGVSLEGVGYFNYGMSYYLAFAAELLEQGDRTLLKGDDRVVVRLRQLAAFIQAVFLENGNCVNFSDATPYDKILPGIARGFSMAGVLLDLPQNAYAGFNDDPCYRFAGLWLGIRPEKLSEDSISGTGKESGEAIETGSKNQGENENYGRTGIFSQAEWAVFQSENGCAFAIKGGNNGEPHNHNDVGNFIYYRGDRCLVCDLGAGEYTADYFGEGRYGYLCCSSKGHSVPIVGGQYQEAGKDHGSSAFQVTEAGDTVTIAIEYHKAYPEGACEYLERRAEFNTKNGTLTVTDLCDREFTSVTVSKEKPEICLLTGEITEEENEIFKNHQGITENVILEMIKAKETNHEILTDRDNSRRLFCASFSISAGLL